MGFEGTVSGIYIATEGSGPVERVEEVLAIEGKGLEGDRYCARAGTYSDDPKPGREVTLIEAEAVEAIRHEDGIELEPGQIRRNIVTKGVPLNHLVGREFRVGEVVLRGVRLCEPCAHVSKLTGHSLVQPLLHRAGLRADIVTGGTIRTGDAVTA